ncbi:MAG: sensor histidine kinase [Solirubrobacteraceae bacterium]|jgi:signal transduction histidine kinase
MTEDRACTTLVTRAAEELSESPSTAIVDTSGAPALAAGELLEQRLVSIAMSLGVLEMRVTAATGAKPLVRETREALALALAELRELTHGINPSLLTERGLPARLDELCRRAALPAQLDVALDRRLPDQIESAAYFMASEALTNAAKHSHATAIRVAAAYTDQQLTVEVVDDGIGGATAAGGSGLRGLADP